VDAPSQIDVLIRARYSILYVVSWEEDRVEASLREIARKRDKRIFTWTITHGMVGDGETRAAPSTDEALAALDYALEYRDPAIFVLRDFDPFLDEPAVERKNAAEPIRASRWISTTRRESCW